MTRRLSVAGLLLLGMALASCGNTAAPASVKAPISSQGRVPAARVCGFYSEADASAALGVTVQPRTKTVRGDQCTDTGPSASELIVTIVAGSDINRGLASARQAPRAAPVSGLGDEAVWSPYRGEMVVRRGDRGLLIQIFSVKLSGTQARDQAEKLARIILAKI